MKSVLKLILGFYLLTGDFIMGAQAEFYYKSDFLSGFDKEISGETINYYTLASQSLDALLVRSLDAKNYIEWQTQAIPADYDKDMLSFVMIASLQVNKDSHRFDVYLNDEKYFTFSNPVDRSLNTINIEGAHGSRLEFNNLEYDRFDDLNGFLFFHVPANKFEKGKPVKIRVAGESAGSRSWFMVFKHPCRSKALLASENVVLNSPDVPKQSMRVKILHMTSPQKAVIKIGSTVTGADLKFGFNNFSAGLERIDSEKELPVEVKIGSEIIGDTLYKFKPVTPVIVYLLPHSHTDIGYTHVQDEVKRIQWDNIEKGIELAEKTADYPEGARYKWNAEVLWATDEYLTSASPEKRQRYIDAVKKGYVGIDGLYANFLTGLLSPEEWTWMAEAIRRVGKEFDIKIESAMISDIPGWSWSIVPALANSGIKYFSCGINPGDRIGSIRRELGDKPFYWVSPSGKEKVLTWVHEQGYAAFHYVSKQGAAEISVIEPTIINYINKLADDDYPYDLVSLRYTIGADNGPPDKYMSDNVKEWNERYLSPKLVIATTTEFFHEFEKKYGDQLPEVSGDITPYWEDGAASSSYETSLNRQAADKLNLAANLYAQYKPKKYPTDLFNKAWGNILLYDEHTWGAWNSISHPDDEFTKQQWRIKQAFAFEADKLSNDILKSAISSLSGSGDDNAIEVINTLPVKRTDIVNIPEKMISQINEGLTLIDENGMAVPVQQLSDSTVVFLASDIPAFGSKRFYLGAEKSKQQFNPVIIEDNVLKNEFLTIELDEQKASLSKIMLNGNDKNLINADDKWGAGGYMYVNGRKPENLMQHEIADIKIKENGPLVSSWILQMKAPGCDTLEQEIKVTAGTNRVEIKYTITKQKVYTPEAIRVAFPFNVPGGKIKVENAFGYYTPEAEQIKGSCKNFYTMNNYVDVSNSDYGVSLVSPDAPLIEIGTLTNDANVTGWLDKSKEGTSIYSFLMNNYWHTNFLASQEGISSYRYLLYPHNGFNPTEAAANGVFAEQPLVVIPVEKEAGPLTPMMSYDNKNVFITAMHPVNNGKAVWITFYNASESTAELQPAFINKPGGIYLSDLLKNKKDSLGEVISIDGNGIKSVLVEW